MGIDMAVVHHGYTHGVCLREGTAMRYFSELGRTQDTVRPRSTWPRTHRRTRFGSAPGRTPERLERTSPAPTLDAGPSGPTVIGLEDAGREFESVRRSGARRHPPTRSSA